MKKLSRAEKAPAVAAIQEWFRKERDEEIGELGAELLLDALTATAGRTWYNEGVRDARAQLSKAVDVLDEQLFALEVPADGREVPQGSAWSTTAPSGVTGGGPSSRP